jgi:trehalose 6-phosphate phosphatase
MADAAPASQLNSRVEAFLYDARRDAPHTLVALDIDGTISEIAPTPEEAVVTPRMRGLLVRLAEAYPLAFLSGRDAEVALRMAGVPKAIYVGAHGLETLDEAGVHSPLDREAFLQSTQTLAEAVRSDVPEVGPHIEEKRWGVGFHYRQIDEPVLVERLLKSIERHLPGGLRLRHGKKVAEVVPDVVADKGTAVTELIERLGPRRVLAAGDDRTDVATFRALAEGRSRGWAFLRVAVLGSDEPPPELLASADYQVRGVEGTYHLLSQLLDG